MKQLSRTRTATTKRIAAASLVNRIISMVCRFAVRTVFAESLGKAYLGVGGMFGNVFGVLSVLEGGVGEAVSQMLYRPLATHDEVAVTALIRRYRQICRMVALVSLAVSLSILPFLPLLFRDIDRIEHYRGVYLLFCAHQTLSYLYAPCIAMLSRDRRADTLMNCRSVTTAVSAVCCITLLRRGGSYLLYMAVHIAFHAVDGLYAALAVRRLYPYLNTLHPAFPDSMRRRLRSQTRSLFVHRVAAAVNQSTDSLLISSVLGLTRMGVFSNYSLIVGTLGSFVSLVLGSAASSVGNLGATENADKNIDVLKQLCRIHTLLVTNAAALLLAVITPVISLWQGRDMCFGSGETAIITACFFFSYIRDPVQIFLNAYGIFDATKYVYLARALLNLLFSLVFVGRYGMVGVFAGTLLSTALTALPLEPYLLFRRGFERPAYSFMLRYFTLMLGGAALVFGVNAALFTMPTATPQQIIIKIIVVLASVNAAFSAAWCFEKGFGNIPANIKKGVPENRNAA